MIEKCASYNKKLGCDSNQSEDQFLQTRPWFLKLTVDVGQDVFEGRDEKRVEVVDVADELAQKFTTGFQRIIGRQAVH